MFLTPEIISLSLCVFHLSQFLLYIVLSFDSYVLVRFPITMTTVIGRPGGIPVNYSYTYVSTNSTSYYDNTNILCYVNVLSVIAIIFLLSSLLHLGSSGYIFVVERSPFAVHFSSCCRVKKEEKSPLSVFKNLRFQRWLEYSITFPLITMVVLLQVGMTDLYAILGFSFCSAGMILFAYAGDVVTSKYRWRMFYFSCLFGVIPWLFICFHIFWLSIHPPMELPLLVLILVGCIFYLSILQGINEYMYINSGHFWCLKFGFSKETIEYIHHFLSLVIKSLLGGITAGSILSFSNVVLE